MGTLIMTSSCVVNLRTPEPRHETAERRLRRGRGSDVKDPGSKPILLSDAPA